MTAMSTTVRSIEMRALNLLRRAEALARPVDLDKVAAALGVLVHRETLEEEVSGVLIVKGEEKHVLLNKRQDRRRQRFTLGHELGHLVLHHTHGDRLIVDKQIRVYRRVGEPSSREYRDPDSMTDAREEQEANTFSAALLMPAPLMRRAALEIDLRDERDISSLSGLFDVSEPAMVIRLQNLNLVHTGFPSPGAGRVSAQQPLFA